MLYLLLTLILVGLLLNFAAAKHAVCYWTGPGTGTPEQQGFSFFCVGKRYDGIINANTPDRREILSWQCDGFEDHPVVADWNKLRDDILEISTACGGNGYSGDCSFGLWAAKLVGYIDPLTNETDPVRYLRKTDDCEWAHPMKYQEAPDSITIYHK